MYICLQQLYVSDRGFWATLALQAPDIDVAGMQAHELLKADLRLERKAAERRSRMAARKYQKQLEKESSIAYQQRRVEAARTIQRCWGWYKGIRRMRKMHAAMELAKEQEIEREVQFAVDRVCNDVIKRDMEERAPLLATLQQLAETDRVSSPCKLSHHTALHFYCFSAALVLAFRMTAQRSS
eukprot:COSAG05_NODE_1230_length_5443_cov_6.168600_3_plen_183_part_00